LLVLEVGSSIIKPPRRPQNEAQASRSDFGSPTSRR
jgi:hypothetical protein